MEQLHFRFTTKLDFDSEVKNHVFTLKCIPKGNARQRVDNCKLEINPHTDFFYSTDSYGNSVVNGSISIPHDHFEFTVEGYVTAGLEVYEDFEPNELKNAYYKYHTDYTRPGEKLKEYFDSLRLNDAMGAYEKATKIMSSVNRDFCYEKKVTTISTVAEEAMTFGKGVCQDYAHIMISLCRMAEIPARYTVGLMKGEGESHAWVEALCKGYWYGFDPTNNWLTDGNYIKISSGRDYSDCIVNKGKFIGMANQKSTVSAVVLG